MWPAGEAALPPDVQHKRSYLSVSCTARLCSGQSRLLWDTAALLFPQTMPDNSFIKADLCLEPAPCHYSFQRILVCTHFSPGFLEEREGSQESGGTVQGELKQTPGVSDSPSPISADHSSNPFKTSIFLPKKNLLKGCSSCSHC